MTTTSKQAIISTCETIISSRINELKEGLKKLAVAKTSDSKSSMGDKYETGREMLRQEEHKLEAQLAVYQSHLRAINAIIQQKESDKIGLGSLVQTNTGWFFLGPALGKIETSPVVFCLSLDSPMGKLLSGKNEGDSFELNGRSIKILTHTS